MGLTRTWLRPAAGAAAAAALLIALVLLISPATAPAQTGGTCASCHAERAAQMAASEHAALSCVACHPDAEGHPAGYEMPSASEYFQMEICGACHPDQYATYKHDDGTATTFGGSAEGQPKYETFLSYNTIIDGHGFVREYNEERAHANMTTDHADIKRGKFEVCMQCKSTRVAYYWGTGRIATLQHDVPVTWAPTGDRFTVPAGTTIRLATDTDGTVTGVRYQVLAEVDWAGTVYTSWDKPGATKDTQRTWLAVYAMAIDGLPAGSPSIPNTATCNHCHDPHATELRLIRKELIRQVDEQGVNPYSGTKTSFADAGRKDQINTVCGQCHVEYVCGRSGVDGINRDYIPWAKVRDLEDLYARLFPTTDKWGIATYGQDWIHGTGVRSSAWPNKAAEHPIGVPLIKNQHPETELYWQSAHYQAGLSCAECHMPQVTKAGGSSFTSHWFASPVKYLDPARAGAFAQEFGLDLGPGGVVNACLPCHNDSAAQRSQAIVDLQEEVYDQALEVQDLLVDSLAAINEASMTAGVDTAKLKTAIAKHRSAHVRWEYLAVSENSMGFHNAEAGAELTQAATFARDAIKAAQEAVAQVTTTTAPTTTTTAAPTTTTTAGTTSTTRASTTTTKRVTTTTRRSTTTTVPVGQPNLTG